MTLLQSVNQALPSKFLYKKFYFVSLVLLIAAITFLFGMAPFIYAATNVFEGGTAVDVEPIKKLSATIKDMIMGPGKMIISGSAILMGCFHGFRSSSIVPAVSGLIIAAILYLGFSVVFS